jgi:hypothetical protein
MPAQSGGGGAELGRARGEGASCAAQEGAGWAERGGGGEREKEKVFFLFL